MIIQSLVVLINKTIFLVFLETVEGHQGKVRVESDVMLLEIAKFIQLK
jgi:hypothetical protein